MSDVVPHHGWDYRYPNADGSHTLIKAPTLDLLYLAVAEYQIPPPAEYTSTCDFLKYDKQIDDILPSIKVLVDAYQQQKIALEATHNCSPVV